MRQFTYATKLTPEKKDGGFVVTYRDLPEAITQGESIEEALNEAADCLEEAIEGSPPYSRPASSDKASPDRGGACSFRSPCEVGSRIGDRLQSR
jgi:predicted RNase H-like HicB family nuclease